MHVNRLTIASEFTLLVLYSDLNMNNRPSWQKHLRLNDDLNRNDPFKFNSSLYHRISERSSQRRTSQETRDFFLLHDNIIDEALSRHIIIKIREPANETRERDPEILANVEINGPTIQFGHVIGRDVIDTSLLNLAAK